MAKKIKIGIIGCGAIGSSLAKIIKGRFKGKALVAAIYDLDEKKSFTLAKKLGYNNVVVKNRRELIARSDLVIEATHMRFSYEIAREVLSASKDIMIMSVGGIVEKHAALFRLAEKKQSRIYVPSGALCGLDGLKALGFAKIKKVTLTTTKPAGSFTGVKFVENKFGSLKNIKKDKVLFSGTARAAVKLFPQNINVAAALSLAGIGVDKTRVRIIASPKAKTNTHEVEIDSSAGMIYSRTQNFPHPENPKTSFLAVLSAATNLKQILEPVRVGS
ncbi:MAG: DUF108 domain-containing protein [Candidatus Omnitrophica bacterium]|nr:DUF108 domain-containing protein [Candidatus Omnitrophota bacterium]